MVDALYEKDTTNGHYTRICEGETYSSQSTNTVVGTTIGTNVVVVTDTVVVVVELETVGCTSTKGLVAANNHTASSLYIHTVSTLQFVIFNN